MRSDPTSEAASSPSEYGVWNEVDDVMCSLPRRLWSASCHHRSATSLRVVFLLATFLSSRLLGDGTSTYINLSSDGCTGTVPAAQTLARSLPGLPGSPGQNRSGSPSRLHHPSGGACESSVVYGIGMVGPSSAFSILFPENIKEGERGQNFCKACPVRSAPFEMAPP